MNLFQSGVTAVVLSSVIGPFAQAATTAVPPGRVRALVEKLDDDRFSVRQEADRELRQMGTPVLPLLQQEEKGLLPLEARQRVAAIIADLSQVHWQRDLYSALHQAHQKKKPLLVVCTPGLPSFPSSVATAALQQRTFNNLELVTFLNANFIVVWHDLTPGEIHAAAARAPVPQFTAAQVRECTEGAGGAAHSFFCAPDGTVIRHFVGFHRPATMLQAAMAVRDRPEAPVAATARGPGQPILPEPQMESRNQRLNWLLASEPPVQTMQAVAVLNAGPKLAQPDRAIGQSVYDCVIQIERSMRMRLTQKNWQASNRVLTTAPGEESES